MSLSQKSGSSDGTVLGVSWRDINEGEMEMSRRTESNGETCSEALQGSLSGGVRVTVVTAVAVREKVRR